MSTATIQLDEASHTYSLYGKPFVSVSKVIDAVMKKSWEGVPAEVLANAAERGSIVEGYTTEMLRTGYVTPPNTERDDVLARMEGVERWYQTMNPVLIDAQRKVYSEELGVAGTLDYLLRIGNGICVGRWLVDMKCTAQAEKSWILQLGAYLDLLGEEVDGAAVLHINPSFAKGFIFRAYEVEAAKRQWRTALNWYRTLQELKAEA